MNSVKISIVVPIYNTEKYIERCARSLMEQTLKDEIEFIFIDDATQDNSMIILDSVLSKYPERKVQVRIIHNPQNIGICETRKRGIEAAQGEYIGWCDSDDWCELNMFEEMFNKAVEGNYDIVICNHWLHLKGNNSKHEEKLKPQKTPQDAIKDLKGFPSLPIALWRQISKRNLIIQASNFIHPVKWWEDLFMLLYCFYYAKSAFWINKPLYHHDCNNATSITKGQYITKEEWGAQSDNIDCFESLLKQNVDEWEYRLAINYLKFRWKESYKTIFSSCYEYWKTYREYYKDICDLTDTPRNKRLKVWLIHNFYPMYWLANRRSFR